MTRASLVLAAALLIIGLLPARASAQTGTDFADRTSVGGSQATTTATLNGGAIALGAQRVHGERREQRRPDRHEARHRWKGACVS